MNTQEFLRKLDNLGTIGIVTEIDGGKMRLQIGDNQTDWIVIPALAAGAVKIWRCPSVGEQFAVLSQGGELCNALPIVAIPSDENPNPSTDPDELFIELPDGLSIIINTASGEAVFKLNKILFDVPEAVFTGSVHASKQITSDVDVVASGTSLKQHIHIGVRSGSDVSGVPQ